MTGFSEMTIEEETRVSRRGLAQQAIGLAVQGRWQEAVDTNRQLLSHWPDDAEAYNRLGKAYTELGRIGEAREAYGNSLKADPANLIAQRNLDRLSRINESEAAEIAKRVRHKLDPHFFMEETGKTGVVTLQHPAGPDVLATLTAGNEVRLEQDGTTLVVTAMDGAYLGRVDERLAARLIRLIQAGNRYQAGVVGADERSVRIIIRETYQAPQNAGRISFPPQVAQEALPRPYLREGLMRRSSDEEDEDELDVELVDTDSDDEDDDDVNEFGFHESGLG